MRFEEADDSRWLATVIDQFEGPLVRYAQRITGDLEQARDAAQDTFLRLCRERRGTGDGQLRQDDGHLARAEGHLARAEGHLALADGHLARWLFTVCRNRAIDIRKKEVRMHSMTAEQAESRESRESASGAAIEASDEAARITTLLAAIPASQQEVVRLKFQESLSYRDISTITGLSITNVGYLLHTALKTVRQQMHARNGER